jgi:hypothetical protein
MTCRRAALLGVLIELLVQGPAMGAGPPSHFDGAAWLDAAATQSIDVIVYEAGRSQLLNIGSVLGPGIIDSETRPDARPDDKKMRNAADVFADELIGRLANLTTATLSRKPGLRPLPIPKDPSVYREISQADYVLEIAVPGQLVTYQGLKAATYTYFIMPSVRLIDTKTGHVLWLHDKGVKPDRNDPALHLKSNEFAANDGQRLREVRDAALLLNADRAAQAFVDGQ